MKFVDGFFIICFRNFNKISVRPHSQQQNVYAMQGLGVGIKSNFLI